MKQYTHLTLDHRIFIDHNLRKGLSYRKIAQLLNRPHSSISREVLRNSHWKYGYVAHIADERAKNRTKNNTSILFKNQVLQAFVIEKLRQKWSPKMIAGRLKLENPTKSISHETIYKFIYDTKIGRRLELWKLLPRRHKKRIHFGTRKKRGSNIKNLTSIHKRPKSVETRKRGGNWEGDLIINKGGNVAVLLERKTRFILAVKNTTKHSKGVISGIERALSTLPPSLRKSITFDRGTEFAQHERLNANLGMNTYFCDAYSPWQKGGVENANGRLRRFIPKKADIRNLTQEQLQIFIDQMNNTPRPCLDYKTPLECFQRHLKSGALYR